MTNYVYDGLNPVQEKNGATVTANLLTGLGIDEFFTRTDGVGVRALLPDALGSTVALGDGTGTLQTQYTYEPFGYATQTGAASTSSYKYTGREDDGTGLYYYRARYYHPRLQRFIAEDPIGFSGGTTNIYEFVENNPMNISDPLGLESATVMLGIDPFNIPNSNDLLDGDLTRQGLAAFADGIIPHGDPFASGGYYNKCDSRLQYNRLIGAMVRDIELVLGSGVVGGQLFRQGAALNKGQWRIGWGKHNGPVFRIGGPGNSTHYLNWQPSTALTVGYGIGAGAALVDVLLKGSSLCGCQD
ncbi:MAG: RHS repeat-associated core domain-containing protein [Nitrospira sp.]|nr:RHS repeat-associated core domain-containing protein [Nitrospira sp.]